ncbi:MAG: RNA pseudouridine synthase, partial [Angelakisella sp.]
ATLRIMNQKLKDREIEKRYKCLVFGVPTPKHKLCRAYLLKDSDNNQVTVSASPMEGGKTIITEYTVLAENRNFSMLEILLHTGRTHQIRAHMAFLGYPLVGDTKYGTAKQNKGLPYRFQALCAYSITFKFTTNSEHLSYICGRSFEVPNLPFSLDALNS